MVSVDYYTREKREKTTRSSLEKRRYGRCGKARGEVLVGDASARSLVAFVDVWVKIIVDDHQWLEAAASTSTSESAVVTGTSSEVQDRTGIATDVGRCGRSSWAADRCVASPLIKS